MVKKQKHFKSYKVNFLFRIALNIAGVYCFYLLNEIIWYPNFFIGIGFVVVGIFCFIKANDGTFSGNSNDIIPNSHSSEIKDEEVNPLSDEELKLWERRYNKRLLFSIILTAAIGLVAFLSYDDYLTKEEEKENQKKLVRQKKREQEYDLMAIKFSKPEVRTKVVSELKVGDKISLQKINLEVWYRREIISIQGDVLELKGGIYRRDDIKDISINDIRWLENKSQL